ncbi:hypothetical protein BLNAU_905 [Blattamonas nauphoetae]|uniref:Thioesterase putative domain-containing protein n=1 Tax=Blattamonas nauphoetae TaxID=2049346 RepID=A0ABQ9YKU5_9EUKA|nr:hypothetical protein BLNAU_905 [Blattamonas nauphoetae]
MNESTKQDIAQRITEIVQAAPHMNPMIEAMNIQELNVFIDDSSMTSLVVIPSTNIMNDHGSTFGGAIYTAALLCGWSFISSLLPHHGCVIQTATINYHRPIQGKFLICRCSYSLEGSEVTDLINTTRSSQSKGKIPLQICCYGSEDNTTSNLSEKADAVFEGLFHAGYLKS